MSNLVIVALPSEMDSVWEISSEKKPHLTLLFLGETLKVPNITKILEFTEHAAKTSLKPFSLDVDYRGVLGEDEADVLFYKKTWGFNDIARFRGQLLQNGAIKKAYNSVEQFPEWQPHLTLGYPATPAKKIDHKIYYTDFDRIAVWLDDFEGPEFRLEYNDALLEEVAMSTASDGKAFIEHHGVKGMKWGVRRDRSPREVRVTTKTSLTGKARIKTKEGGFHEPHPDAIKVAVAKQKIKKSGPAALSNKELEDVANRLNLEQRVRDLQTKEPPSAAKQVLTEAAKDPKKRKFVADVGKQVVTGVAKKKAAAAVR